MVSDRKRFKIKVRRTMRKLTRIFEYAMTIIVLLAACVLVGAAVISSITFQNIGNINSDPSIAVYSDSSLTTPITLLEWGAMAPEDITTRSIWIKNIGNADGIVTVVTDNFAPLSLSQYLTLTTANGTSLSVDESKQLILSLAISSSITDITSFSFDITVHLD